MRHDYPPSMSPDLLGTDWQLRLKMALLFPN
jgi:hypothetical protein